jgi:hypothetical protein
MTDTPTDAATSPLIHLTTPPPAPKPAAAAPKAAPSARELADMSPQQRFEHQQQEGDRVTGTYRGPERAPGVKVDEATYNRMTHGEKVAYAQEFQPKPSADPNAPPADPAAPPVADPNAARVKIGETELTEAEWVSAAAEKAAKDANLLSLPVKPSDYKLELPADFKAPEGVKFTFNPADPIKGPVINAAREWAKTNNLTQEQFGQLLGLYAGSQAHEAKMISDGAKAQRDLLGPAGTARIDAVSRWLKAEVGDDLARPLLQTLVTEKHVRAYETMIQKKTSQGAGGFRTTGREAPEADGRLPSGPEGEKIWNGMSYTQKKEYTEKFSGPGNSRRGT